MVVVDQSQILGHAQKDFTIFVAGGHLDSLYDLLMGDYIILIL